MCGIAGYLNISRAHCSFDNDLLDRLHNSIEHRGPDGHGVWKSQTHQLALVHRRLSIVDLSSAGAQPMFDAQKTVAIVFNGEIYNHMSLRRELEGLGYRYASQTDTETLLYAYKQWGIDFIHKLEGMFAFALFDIQNNELYVVRDRIGIKPVYFSLQGGVFSFASEIKALWHLPWIEKKILASSLQHYLTYLVTPAPATLYQGIYKLPCAFYIKIDAQRTISYHEWYTPLKTLSDNEQKQFQDEQFCVDGIRVLLKQAIRKRMMSDVPLGVFLSGGIDSSLNVALMSEFTARVKTFNVSFSDGPEYEEVAWARKVATLYNTDHHEIVIAEKEAFDFFSAMVFHQDEPLADCVCIPLYYVSKLCKESGVTVVQVGEGSDELFCGYSTFARYLDIQPWWQPTQRYIPTFAKQLLAQLFSTVFPSKYNHVDFVRNWANGNHLFWSGAVAFPESLKNSFMPALINNPDPIIAQIYPELLLHQSSYEVVSYHLKKLKRIKPEADFLTSMIYLELKQRLPELLLMRVDKMTMATAVEGRVPFLDHALVEFALHIPARFKYHNGITKYILKKAAQGILPNDIIYRKKMGFAAPTKRWFKDGSYFKPFIYDLMHSKNAPWQEYINPQACKQLLQRNQMPASDYSVQLWALQNVIALEGMR